jgi:tetratricopeptide (TPR) repeat protein
MSDDVKSLSAELAQDPQSLVFLRLGEMLRQRGQLDAAHRVAVNGLERHPHLADAHDLLARVLADKRDYERAFDEWDMTLRIAPSHIGALKGLAFLYFKVGDVAQAVAHLEAAQREAPDEPGLAQAVSLVRGGNPAAAARGLGFEGTAAPPPPAAPPAPLEDARVFAGLEGAQEGLLLLDASGQVLGGALRDPSGKDVTAPVAAYLAGVSQEAARTAKLVGLGSWTGLAAEGGVGHVYVTQVTPQTLLLVVRDRAIPMGRLAIIAQRAAQAAARWLERHA